MSLSEVSDSARPPGLVWGVIWLLVAFLFFAAGILVGLAAFKVSSVPCFLLYCTRLDVNVLHSFLSAVAAICRPAGLGLTALLACPGIA